MDCKKIVSVFSGKDSAELMFFEFLDEFLRDMTVGPSTKRGHETKKNKFYVFLGNKDIRFKDIDYDLLKRYRRYLDDEGVKSANRYLKFIKRVYDVAVESDKFMPKSNPFKSFLFDKSIKGDTLNRNLSNEQVAKLLRMDSSNVNGRSLKNTVIDFWKFCFYMRGINLIDIAVLSPKDVKGDYLVFTREKLKTKTKRRQKVRIFPEARAIIDKYLNSKNDFVFPILKNGSDKDLNKKDHILYLSKLSTVNRNLKLVGEEIELDFVMTTMSARYSFINVAKQLEIPFLYLQEFVGHSTRSTTDIYMDVFPQEKIDEYHRNVIDSVLLLEEREEGKDKA